MQPQTIESYFPYVQALSRKLDSDSNALQELLDAIKHFEKNAFENESDREFFKGELAFYQTQYERALNHYLNAKNIEHFKFYCYRASACVFRDKGDNEKALKFIKKALGIYPEDFISQQIFNKLLSQPDLMPQAEGNTLLSHSHEVTGPIQDQSGFEIVTEKPRKFGGKEMEELAGIFEARPCEDLFSFEPPLCNNIPDQLIPAEVPSHSSYVSAVEKPQESTMNTDTHIYNYSSNADPAIREALTQRLYEVNSSETVSQGPYAIFETFRNKVDTDSLSSETALSKANLTTHSNDIDKAIQSFHSYQSAQLSNYLECWLKRPPLPDHSLQIFHGWKEQSVAHQEFQAEVMNNGGYPKASGGFYLRWNNKGIVINPGKHFLHHLHRFGLHIKDIDIVIVTNELSEAYADIQEIYELNFRLNRASGDQHIIHYYLNQSVYQALSSLFKPHSKMERNAIHSLELFPDSPEVEQITIAEGITLNYFALRPQSALQPTSRQSTSYTSSLGIRLDMSTPTQAKSLKVTFGYISRVSWSPSIAQYLANCDVLLAGIGNTNPTDYNKIVHLDECLGYYGVSSLLEDASPKLLLCAEFGASQGDLRLELIKKMRAEQTANTSAILPADVGMCLDLKTLAIKCSITHKYVNPAEVRVIRSLGLFGPLHYLAPASYL